ncbi:Nucleolar protein NOP5 [Giardia lamblia P15]|uniref:Nucleolar protein NOP5 n=1 Tax=Giardia intestinalis (strain P15) TaxID=658858 RepID=E1F5U7_GIAIA|nr:Nucleolar protein NOP5 [Giardia lamblia P15]
MYLLYEAASGLAMFKVLDESKLKAADLVGAMMRTSSDVQKIVSLVSFSRFPSVEGALATQTSAFEKDVSEELKQFVEKHFANSIAKKDASEKLLVQDPHLVTALKDVCGIRAAFNDMVVELSRGIRTHLASILPDFDQEYDSSMAMGLAHSFSRYRVKFNADSIDIMLIQAIALIDDTEKDINQFAMRLREWMVWHFPELINIVPDNINYAKTVVVLRDRRHLEESLTTSDREKFIKALNKASRDQAYAIISAAKTSVGTDITNQDSDRVVHLAEELLSLVSYREELHEYIEARMLAVAPNFTRIVGSIVGVRLLAKAGSLLNLAKLPASTLQILGSERALFRAKKMRSKQTPKYGFIYHATLVGKASAANRGKMARVVATNASLAARVDALSESSNTTFAKGKLEKINASLRFYEGDKQARSNRKSVASQKMEAYRRGIATGYEGKGDMKISREMTPAAEPKKTRMTEAFEEDTGFVQAKTSQNKGSKTKEHAQERQDDDMPMPLEPLPSSAKKDDATAPIELLDAEDTKDAKEKHKEKSKEKHRDKDKEKHKEKEKEKEKHKDKHKDKDKEGDKEKHKDKDKHRDKDKEKHKEKHKSKDDDKKDKTHSK